MFVALLCRVRDQVRIIITLPLVALLNAKVTFDLESVSSTSPRDLHCYLHGVAADSFNLIILLH